MFKSYFISALNNLNKFRLFSIINIVGLAIGLAASILIALYVQKETSYDRHWNNAESIYRVQTVTTWPGELPETEARVSMLTGPALQQYFSEEIITTARKITRDWVGILFENLYFSESISFVDKDFIEIFQFEELAGDLQNTFVDNKSLALSEETSRRIFGDRNPVGEVITVSFFEGGDSRDYRISAVYRLAQGNTVLKVPMLGLFDGNMAWNKDTWNDSSSESFILLANGVDVESISSRLEAFVDQQVNIPDLIFSPGQALSEVFNFHLQLLSDTYFDEPAWPYLERDLGSSVTVMIFSLISILVLLIACTNYVILTMARSAQRAREVALRKVAGARNSQLILQFLGESLLLTFLALFLAISLVELLLPFSQNLLGQELHLSLTLPRNYLALLLILLVVSVAGGIYPALRATKFSPGPSLKENQSSMAKASTPLRNILVVFQFSISITLIIATSLIYQQLVYTDKLDPGYTSEHLIEIAIGRPEAREKREVLSQEISALAHVESVTSSGLNPVEEGGAFIFMNYFKGGDISANATPTITTGYQFFETLQIPLLAGRYFDEALDQEAIFTLFSQQQETSDVEDGKVIFNRAAIRQLGYVSIDEAIGSIIQGDSLVSDTRLNLTIIGVVEDSQFRSPRVRPAPEAYRLAPDGSFFLMVRFSGDSQLVLNELEEVWHRVVGDIVFEATVMEERLGQVFQKERSQGYLLILFSLLAIFIACLGLYGVASFSADRRRKEIGIRRVLGASVWSIVLLLTHDFSKPVLLSNILAWPIAYFAMERWLENFAYRIDITPVVFIGSGLIALCIAWATTGGTAMKAAKLKPVATLRYE